MKRLLIEVECGETTCDGCRHDEIGQSSRECPLFLQLREEDHVEGTDEWTLLRCDACLAAELPAETDEGKVERIAAVLFEKTVLTLDACRDLARAVLAVYHA